MIDVDARVTNRAGVTGSGVKASVEEYAQRGTPISQNVPRRSRVKLPWLELSLVTEAKCGDPQDAGVILGEPGRSKIPNDSKVYVTIPMSFASGSGDTPKDTYVLYIDPDTYRLKASEYGMTYKSMMPEGVEEMPRSIFVWDGTTKVDGLVVLTQYNVYWKHDGSAAVVGEVSNWSFQRPFDASRMKMPSDGSVDQSQP